MPDPTDAEKKLLDTLDDTENANAPLQQDAQRILTEAREHRDVARELSGYVQANPQTLDPTLVKQLTEAFQRQNDAARGLRADMREAIHFYTAQSSLSSVVASTGVATTLFKTGPNGLQPTFKMPYTEPQYSGLPTPQRTQLATALHAIYSRQEMFSTVREALVSLGLDKAAGNQKSPVGFLDQAKANLAAPSGEDTEAIAVLLSLRSCISQALNALMLRRQKQEPTGSSWKSKLASLGTQCGRPNLPSGYFEILADLAVTHADVFDGSKQQAIPRAHVMLQIDGGLRFLHTLLSGIDKDKLRA